MVLVLKTIVNSNDKRNSNLTLILSLILGFDGHSFVGQAFHNTPTVNTNSYL